MPGSGAAGGTAAGLIAIADRFASFDIRPGGEVLMELTGFEDALAASDVVLTGEGLIDVRIAYGKAAMGVAQSAHDTGVRCICFGGGATPEGHAALAKVGAIVVPLIEAPMSVEEAMAADAGRLARAAERAARLVG